MSFSEQLVHHVTTQTPIDADFLTRALEEEDYDVVMGVLMKYQFYLYVWTRPEESAKDKELILNVTPTPVPELLGRFLQYTSTAADLENQPTFGDSYRSDAEKVHEELKELAVVEIVLESLK